MMIVGFDSAWEQLKLNEGGFSNDPLDPGGATMWGCTEKVAREEGYLGAMRDMPESFAKGVAFRRYWRPHLCDQLPAALAFHVFDAAYNGGHPAVWLQQAVRGVASVDGIIGPATVAAVRAADPERVMRLFGAYRELYLVGLEGFGHDGRGWIRRCARNQLATA
jgi:lysozyme family protein